MRRPFTIALLLMMLLYTSVHAQSDLDASLIAKTREKTPVMHAIAGMEDFVSLYSSDEGILKTIHSIAGYDYANPESAVVITVPNDCIAGILPMLNIDAPKDSDIFRALKGKLYNAVPSMLNSRASTVWLATTSVLGISDTYLPEVPFDGIAYVLLRYKGEQPGIVCAFNMNGNVASVTANYIDTTAIDSAGWMAGASALLDNLSGMNLPIDLSGIAINEYSGDAL